MELTLEQALAGRMTSIKGKEYLSTEAYVTPFLEKMSKYTDKFIFNGIQPNQVTLTRSGDINIEDITWNRMWVQAIMPDDHMFDNHDRVVGMVYGLDVRKPIMKFYVGGLNRACCNLCVFSPSFLSTQEIDSESAIDYRPIERLMEQTDNVSNILKRFSETEVPYDEVSISKNLGDWVRRTIDKSFNGLAGKVSLSSSTPVDVYKSLYKKTDSPYYVKPGDSTNMFNVYNAWTQVITDDKRDIINKVEKTLLINDILGTCM